jgi:hypothetical protein
MSYCIFHNNKLFGADMVSKSSPKYPNGSPKFNLMMGKKVVKKPSPKASKKDTSPRGIMGSNTWSILLLASVVYQIA